MHVYKYTTSSHELTDGGLKSVVIELVLFYSDCVRKIPNQFHRKQIQLLVGLH